MSDSADERRTYSRVRFDAPAILHTSKAEHAVTVLDLSLKGALLKLDSELAPNKEQRGRLEINLGSVALIEMDLELAHQQDLQAGFRCVNIELDSMIHLRRVVELNTGDAALLERELAQLAKD